MDYLETPEKPTPPWRQFISLFFFAIIGLALPITLFLGYQQQDIRQRAQEGASAPCAHVVTQAASISASFCQDKLNPIQDAINYARENKHPEVRLDSGIFDIRDAIVLSSGVHLKGSENLSARSVLKVVSGSNVDNVVIYMIGDPANDSSILTDSSIENIEIDGKNIDPSKWVGAITSKNAKGVNIRKVHVHDIPGTGMVLGSLMAWVQDPATGQGTVYNFDGDPQNYVQVTDNILNNVTSDGIEVTGHYVEIARNTVTDLSGNENGITAWTGSSNLKINDNTIARVSTGIGIDGAYPGYLGSSSDPNNNLAEMGKGNEQGFANNLTIENNSIENSKTGIVLWRNRNQTVRNNKLSGNGSGGSIGIMINESRDNLVYGNDIASFETGITLRSIGYSKIGSSYNGIGVYKDDQGAWQTKGNIVNNATRGIFFDGTLDFLVGDTLRGNQISSSGIACNLSGGKDTVATNNIPESCNNSIGPTPTPLPPTATPTPSPTPTPASLSCAAPAITSSSDSKPTGSGTVKLTWDKAPGAKEYKVQRQSNSGSWSTRQSSSKTSFSGSDSSSDPLWRIFVSKGTCKPIPGPATVIDP